MLGSGCSAAHRHLQGLRDCGAVRGSQLRPIVVVAAGIARGGTLAAGEFLVDSNRINEILNYIPKGWDRKKIEIVLETQVIKGRSGPPRIDAAHVVVNTPSADPRGLFGGTRTGYQNIHEPPGALLPVRAGRRVSDTDKSLKQIDCVEIFAQVATLDAVLHECTNRSMDLSVGSFDHFRMAPDRRI
jgi:hypothetical protein